MKLQSELPNNEVKSLCSTCKTSCCTTLPGAVFAEQLLKITVEVIKKMLEEGYVIDWWEGDARGKHYDLPITMYLRPNRIGHEHEITDAGWPNAGACIFLTPTGCKHEFKNRPRECQGLVPGLKEGTVDTRQCRNKLENSKQHAALSWIPYQEIIQQTINLIRNGQETLYR